MHFYNKHMHVHRNEMKIFVHDACHVTWPFYKRLLALHQRHPHSRYNTWLQWIGQRQLQDETRINQVLVIAVPYIRDFMVNFRFRSLGLRSSTSIQNVKCGFLLLVSFEFHEEKTVQNFPKQEGVLPRVALGVHWLKIVFHPLASLWGYKQRGKHTCQRHGDSMTARDVI